MRGAPATAVLETLERAADRGALPATADHAVRSVCVLLNRSAGSMEGDQGSSVEDRLTAAFREFDVSMNLELVDGDGLEASAVGAVAAAERGAIDAIVVGGGDGSVRTVAGAVAGSDIPVGILPLGTLNHFARDLGLPLDLEQAVATVASGISRRVDLGEVNGRVFINNSSVGIYPYMVLDRERRRSRSGLPKWTAMAFALVRGLWRFPRRRLTVHAQDSVAAYRTPCLFVGNNRYDLDFLSVGRRETLDAGDIDMKPAGDPRPSSASSGSCCGRLSASPTASTTLTSSA